MPDQNNTQPNFPEMEEEILKFWEDNKIFQKSLEQTKNGKPYTFYDGPPFASGLPHYGHILASTIKDVIPRYQTMKGRFVRRRWGWDCHGLPIEEITERSLGISGKKQIEEIGIKKFNEICRSKVMQYVNEWQKTVRRIARWIDFDNSYKTMDRDYMESVWWAFKQAYDKGLVYEGRKVLLYCPRCETPISNFEVAMDNSYQTITEESVIVKFQITKNESQINSKFQIPNSKFYFLAWTTTPWTLPGNIALAVGEDIEYALVQVGDERYILAADRINEVFKFEIRISPASPRRPASLSRKRGERVEVGKSETNSKFKILNSKFKGKDLVGLEYEPLFNVPAVKSDKSFKVYPADFVTTEDGTGIVHTAVVYGEDDYQLGIKYGLPSVPLLDEKGKFNEHAPELIRGQEFKKSEKIIKQDLEGRGLMFKKEMHTHSYPHCWRCGTTLFYNAIPAWFVNIQKIKKGLLKTNEVDINWYPEHLKHGRYQKSVEAAPDWNVSRNRYWGNPMPVWKCDNKECGHVTVAGSIKELGLDRNTFYFSRHGEARQNILNIESCFPEKEVYDLTKDGLARAEALGKKLKKLGGVDLIFSSDLLRTKHTAEIVGEIFKVKGETDPRLREYNVGVYNGRSCEDFDRDFPYEVRDTEAPEGGETHKQIEARLLDFINEVNAKYKDQKILVISHGDPLWILQKYYGSEREYPNFAEIFELDVSIVDLHRPYIDEVVLACSKCGGLAHRISEIFDSWVEAGSMPFAEYHYPFDNKKVFEDRLPAQFVAEYIAQTRAWFYVMHVISFILFKKVPFENVVTTGTILAEDGSKMSKSKNNFPDPWAVINKYGVDSLRFYLMNSAVMQADNLNFSERDLETAHRKIILILWNVFNYYQTYSKQSGWTPSPNSKFQILNSSSVLDQWIWAKSQELINKVTEFLDNYDTVRATRVIDKYINDLSTWYLRRSRGRKDEEFFLTLRHCLIVLSKVIAPVMPYISELIYRSLNRKIAAPSGRASSIIDGREAPSVHLTAWLETKELNKAQKIVLEKMQVVREMVEVGHSQRKAAGIKLRQPLLGVNYTAAKQLEKEYEEVLADELNVKSVSFKPGKLAKNIPFTLEYDTTITPELKKEGLIRELERAVQGVRKTSGLKVGESVDLIFDTEDAEIIEAFKGLDTKKVFVRNLEQKKIDSEEVIEVDGKKVVIKLVKS